jgi:hypothetical protein
VVQPHRLFLITSVTLDSIKQKVTKETKMKKFKVEITILGNNSVPELRTETIIAHGLEEVLETLCQFVAAASEVIIDAKISETKKKPFGWETRSII